MIRNSLIFLAVLFLPFFAVFAQEADSSIIITAKRINELSKKAIPAEIDTSLISFHFYNPVYKETFSPQYLGNSGSAFQNNYFSRRTTESPFVFANPFLVYFHNPYKRLHYNTHKPFTEVSYVSAGNRETSEQVLGALHTQNVNQYTNIGLEYNMIASRGIYLNQEVKANAFTLFGSFDKENYSIYNSLSLNKNKSIENGGLFSIPAFLVHQASDPIAYRMNLDDASSTVRNVSVFTTQSYRFKKTVVDTTTLVVDTSLVKSDSSLMAADTVKQERFKEKDLPFMINHTLRYDRFYRLYNDVISPSDSLNFYPNNFYNLSSAYDSAFHYILENSIQISGDEYKFLPGFILGLKHQLSGYSYLFPQQTTVTVNTFPVDTILPADFSKNYNNLSVYAMLLFESKSRITYQGKAEYYFAGYRLNDILTDFYISYKLKSKGGIIKAAGKFYATEPDYYLKHYYSSHFQWNTTFPKSTNTSASVSYSSGDGTVYAEGGLSLLGNYIYLDNMALPAKADKNILVSSFRLEKKFKWGGFNHIHKFILQKVNQEALLQLPLMAYGNTSYYENAFFKGVLKFQIGFDFYVNSSYYADAWMPATGMFYRQDIARTGEYPFLDGFVNWKIKRARFFLKYTNALAGVAGYNYFTSYGYPMNPGSVKFGLSWTFYD